LIICVICVQRNLLQACIFFDVGIVGKRKILYNARCDIVFRSSLLFLESAMYRTIIISFFLVSFFLLPGVAEALVAVHRLESPNKVFKIDILIGPIDQTWGRVYFKGEQVLTLNNLDFQLDDGEFVPTPLISKEFIDSLHDESSEDRIAKIWGRQSGVMVPRPTPREVRNTGEHATALAHGLYQPDHRGVSPPVEPDGLPKIYNESVVEYKGVMKIVFRAYDEGIAFCYEFETKENEPIKLKRELSQFEFKGDYSCLLKTRELVPISKIEGEHDGPIVVEIPDGPVVSLSESRSSDFARLRFLSNTERANAITVSLDGEVAIPGTGKPYRTPWRSIQWPPVLP